MSLFDLFYNWIDKKCDDGCTIHEWEYQTHFPSFATTHPHVVYKCKKCGQTKSEYGDLPDKQTDIRARMHQELDNYIKSKTINNRIDWFY